jgi:DnaK suppressor protein
MLTDHQLSGFKALLKERFGDLREEIRQELLRCDEQQFIDLAGQVHDLEEESVADVLVDLNLAILDLHIEEIRSIDAALIRVANASYGVCVDCETGISTDRLNACITAQRCTPCQTSYEHNHMSFEGHTL